MICSRRWGANPRDPRLTGRVPCRLERYSSSS
jgi:hypothetical protein